MMAAQVLILPRLLTAQAAAVEQVQLVAQAQV
jgi:hypothetical protein